ncbi:hypothetical protein Fcan01_26172 [Folsomia candida]|uniref:Uncharacterized protein n=1 Tax=Folsomia candida TaxID=158441 RepID=A0A226D1F3_FOLCA|nr:hypothetical protein Fcan01_26172 [Folsomia candida]
MSQFSPADYEHQRIRETKSRAASHCKVALILSAPYVDPDVRTLVQRDGRFGISILCRLDNVVIEFVTLETYKNNLDSLSESALKIIFFAANETLVLKQSCSFNYFKLEVDSEPGDMFDMATMVVTKTSGYQFLSCYREEYITFKFYITPFKPMLWVSLIISLISIVVITSIYKHYGELRTVSFAPWLFILATIFEESGHIPTKLEINSFFRLILGAWCLVSVILTNCYNGIMISELNAPLSAFRPTIFDHLICEKLEVRDVSKLSTSLVNFVVSLGSLSDLNYPLIITQPETSSRNGLTHIEWYLRVLYVLHIHNVKGKYNYWTQYIQDRGRTYASTTKCFHFLSLLPEYTARQSGFPEFMEYLFDHARDTLVFQRNTKLITNRTLQMLSLSNPRHIHYPKTFNYSDNDQSYLKVQIGIEDKLVDCGKAILITKSDTMNAELLFLNRHYSSKKFYKGKEILRPEYFGWKFHYFGTSKVPAYFQGLIQNGIYERLREEAVRRKYLHRAPRKKFEAEKLAPAVELNGAIITLFILFGGTVLVGYIVFIIEFFHSLCQNNYCLLWIHVNTCSK